jgi:hypothetical protein
LRVYGIEPRTATGNGTESGKSALFTQNQRLNVHQFGYTLLGACGRGLGARWLLCAEWLLSWSFTVGRTGEPWQRWEVRRLAGVAVHGGCLTAVRLNSHTPYGDGAALHWGCSHRTLIRAQVRGEARHLPLAGLAQPRRIRWARSADFRLSPPTDLPYVCHVFAPLARGLLKGA